MSNSAPKPASEVKPPRKRRRWWWKLGAAVLLLFFSVVGYSYYRASQRAAIYYQLTAKGIVLFSGLGPDHWKSSLIRKLPDNLKIWIPARLPPVSAFITSKLADSDMERLSSVTSLESVHLERLPFSEAGLIHLTSLPNLRYLTVSNPFSRECLPHLSRFKSLETLSIEIETPTDDDLYSISQIENLKHLSLWGSRVSAKGIEHLSRLNQLQSLTLGNANIDDQAIISINKLHGIRCLTLYGITDAKLMLFQGLDRIESLSLLGDSITDGSIAHLLKFKKLKLLSLEQAAVTDDAIKSLKQMKHLESINVKGTKITPAGEKELRDALPHLKFNAGNYIE